MKRAFPQKVKPVPPHSLTSDAVEEPNKQVPTEVNRRACTSAAMIGLAISMGASSLLLPRQSDKAMAAEPMAEPTVAAAPAYEVSAVSTPAEPEAPTVELLASEFSATEHTVQAGQTLWKIARLYQVDVPTLASANNLGPSSALQVGQVLQIPAGDVATSVEAAEVTTEQPAVVEPAAPAESADLLKEKQDVALERLKQKRDELKTSLAELGAEENQIASSATAAPEASAAVKSLDATVNLDTNSEVVAYQAPVAATATQLQEEIVETNQVAPAAESQSRSVVEPVAPEITEAAEPQPPQFSAAATITPTIPAPQAPETKVEAPTVATEPQTPKAASLADYRVNPGDTLDAIARKHGISRAELAKANGITDPNFIKADQVLRVPQSAATEESTIASFDVPTVPTTMPPTLVASAIDVAVPTIPTITNASSSNAVKSVEAPRAIASVASKVAKVDNTPVANNSAKAQGSTQVATAPLSNESFSDDSAKPASEFDPQADNNPYVNNLRSEILKLREKYRANGQGGKTPSGIAAAKAVPTLEVSAAPQTVNTVAARQINPEFSPSRYTKVLQAEIRSMQQKRQGEASQSLATVTPAKVEQKEQIVAAAPLGSDAYDPLVKPLVGQAVSPDLPPLAAADRYLPENAASFEGYIWPAKGVLTSGFGPRWGRMHKGIDIAAPVGTPIVASAPGVVITAGWNDGGYGYLVEIQHPDGSVTLYGHNNRILVRTGQQVAQGQQIAEMGSTGYSTGPHSHFEIHAAGKGAVNPMTYLASR